MFDVPKIIMANSSSLREEVLRHIYSEGVFRFLQLRDLVSSPRLADHLLEYIDTDGLVLVGDSFLNHQICCGECERSTYAISLDRWLAIKDEVRFARDGAESNEGAICIQVWPFDPSSLSLQALSIAVSVSYSDLELQNQPKTAEAINMLVDRCLNEWNEGM